MLCAIGVHAQKLKINTVPEGLQKAYLDGKDTVPIVNLREIYIYPQVKFKNKREQARYTKLVRDVKRTLPYAKMVYETLIETYEYIETLPDEKSRQAHLKRMEKELSLSWWKEDYSDNCLKKSQITIPVVTDTFNECLVPYCGISIHISQLSTTHC